MTNNGEIVVLEGHTTRLIFSMIINVIMMMVTNHVDENGKIMTVTNGNDVDSTDHGEEATGHPDDETHVDAARALKNSGWGDEDSAADDAPHDHLGHRGCHDDGEAEDGNQGWQR